MNIGGIDIGTSGVKCAVYNENGTCVGFSRKDYSYIRDDQGYCLNPCQVWQSVKEALREAALQCKGEIHGIAVSSIGEACVLMDSSDRVLFPSILYNDKRGKEESLEFIEKFGQERIYSLCGTSSNGTYSAEKLRWIFSHEKDAEKVDKIFLYEDYIIYCLTGERKISFSLASRTLAFDIIKKQWIDQFLSFAGTSRDKMSDPVSSGTETGEIKKSLAEELGLKIRTKVFTGGHDQLCCTLGTGMLLGNTGVNVSGSGDTVSFLLKKPVLNAEIMRGGYGCSPYAEEGFYTTYGLCAMSGTMIRWYKDIFGQGRRDFYEETEKELPGIETDIVVLPGFTIMGTPDFKLDSQGLMDGFTLKTSPLEIYRGILEGIAFHLKMNLDLLKRQGIEAKVMYVAGGGANSRVWNQIKADIWGNKIVQTENQEAGTAGCAILAGVGLNVFKDCTEASQLFVKPVKEYFPRKQSKYNEKYARFLKLYQYKKERMEEEDAGK